MTIRVKKLFAGKISIRGYEVVKCIKNKEDIKIQFNNETMIIPWNQLKLGTTTGQMFTSRYGDKKYKLVDYLWRPINESQDKLI